MASEQQLQQLLEDLQLQDKQDELATILGQLLATRLHNASMQLRIAANDLTITQLRESVGLTTSMSKEEAEIKLREAQLRREACEQKKQIFEANGRVFREELVR